MTTEEKTNTFLVSNGLITPDHHDKIGSALWEFLWLIDKTTADKEEDGVRWGKVLGGKPITANDIANDLGTHPETIKKNLRRLEEHGYIRSRRAPKGQVFDVRKSIKWLKRSHGGESAPSNQGIIAELVARYREIPGVVPGQRDYGVIGQQYNNFGPDQVTSGIAKLKAAMAIMPIADPLAYLIAILKPKVKNSGHGFTTTPAYPVKRKAREGCTKCGGTGKLKLAIEGTKEVNIVTCPCVRAVD
ncbi:MAG: hypothetical protein H6Q72_4200 [Firmicutes bacterium]|nr:hypothetical protein [Bacillota bacterium]